MLALALVGCDPKREGEAQPCDPFERARPIELRELRGIGRDAEGVVYVVDQAESTGDRVYVSTGGALERQPFNLGSHDDDGPSGEQFIYLLEATPSLVLQILVPPAAPIRMGVAAGELRFFEIGVEGEELEILAAADIADMPVRDLDVEIFVEYIARTHDDRILLVTRPDDGWDYSDFRLYLGSEDAVEERVVFDVGRELDGGTTTIELEIDGVPATAYFPSPYHDLPWTLTVDGAETMLEQLDVLPEPVAFRCLSP